MLLPIDAPLLITCSTLQEAIKLEGNRQASLIREFEKARKVADALGNTAMLLRMQCEEVENTIVAEEIPRCCKFFCWVKGSASV